MERDKALIEMVKEYSCLYNRHTPEFKVQLKKENVWKVISDVLRRSGKYI